MEKAKVSLDTIDFFAVSEGPGSYTGLRIGMAELKGLAFACNKKCILVSTLLSLAQNVIDYNGYVVCALDARVNQFYAAIFKIKDKVITRITEDEALKLEELEKLVPQNALAVGDGAKLLISKLPEKHLKIASDDKIYQRAQNCITAYYDVHPKIEHPATNNPPRVNHPLETQYPNRPPTICPYSHRQNNSFQHRLLPPPEQKPIDYL